MIKVLATSAPATCRAKLFTVTCLSRNLYRAREFLRIQARTATTRCTASTRADHDFGCSPAHGANAPIVRLLGSPEGTANRDFRETQECADNLPRTARTGVSLPANSAKLGRLCSFAPRQHRYSLGRTGGPSLEPILGLRLVGSRVRKLQP